MKINWKVRFKNPLFWIQFLGAIASPILVYYGLNYEDFTTWQSVWKVTVDALKNPFVVFSTILTALGAWGVINDPLIKGPNDSRQGLGYQKPKDPKGL